MIDNNKKYSAIILSAGKSSRMGVHKFSLKYNSTTTFLENLINQYTTFGCEEVVVVLNPKGAEILGQLKSNFPSNVKVVINQHPDWERFYSLKLAVLGFSNANPTFVSNIDNPFANHQLLNSLANLCNVADYVHPVHNGRGGHPFLISKRVVVDLISEKMDQIHLKEFLGRYSKLAIEVDDVTTVINVNTEEEYRRLFRVDKFNQKGYEG
jgi:CTP:molybdopterin cytidylyltransferase MocA